MGHGMEPSGVVPPDVRASPADLPGRPEAGSAAGELYDLLHGREVPFWVPEASGIAGQLGWRWVVLVPALLAAVGLPLGVVLAMRASWPLLQTGLNLVRVWALCVGVVVALILGAARRGVRERRGLFCIHCGYTLEGLAAERGGCPECGRSYVRHICDEYRRDPYFFRARYEALRTHPIAKPIESLAWPTPDDGTT